MNKTEIGKEKERQAVEFLKNKGYLILNRNFRTRFGEVDIVAKDGDTVVFVEVRSKRCVDLGSPEESIGIKKREKLGKVALQFLAGYTDEYSAVRFDVIAVVGDEIRHIKNAFWVDCVI